MVFTIIFLFVVVFFWILPIMICYKKSKEKNRYWQGWTLSGVLFGWMAAIAVLIVPPKPPGDK